MTPTPRVGARFPASARLRARGEFLAVQDRGRRVASKFMTILALPNAQAHDRFGIIASRKLGGAVVRNRAKRRLRAIFRQVRLERDGQRGTPALDLVAIPRRELLTASFDHLTADFQTAMRRLRPTR